MTVSIGGAASSGLGAASDSRVGVSLDLKVHNIYAFECYGADGTLKWREEVPNLVTTEGKNDLLTNYFKGSAYTAAFYVGLVSGAAPTFAAGDIAAQIGGTNGWTESTAYTQANRVTWTGGTASAGSVDNSGSQAVFSINANATIGGAFLITNNTKAGTTGKLYGEAALSTARSLANGDTLNITVTLTV